jgi:hypothetical protein
MALPRMGTRLEGGGHSEMLTPNFSTLTNTVMTSRNDTISN